MGYSDIGVELSWKLEDNGLFDDSELDPLTYVPDCSTETEFAPIDLTLIDGNYHVVNENGTRWELSLEKPLPGVDPGDPYRGVTPCVGGGE